MNTVRQRLDQSRADDAKSGGSVPTTEQILAALASLGNYKLTVSMSPLASEAMALLVTSGIASRLVVTADLTAPVLSECPTMHPAGVGGAGSNAPASVAPPSPLPPHEQFQQALRALGQASTTASPAGPIPAPRSNNASMPVEMTPQQREALEAFSRALAAAEAPPAEDRSPSGPPQPPPSSRGLFSTMMMATTPQQQGSTGAVPDWGFGSEFGSFVPNDASPSLHIGERNQRGLLQGGAAAASLVPQPAFRGQQQQLQLHSAVNRMTPAMPAAAAGPSRASVSTQASTLVKGPTSTSKHRGVTKHRHTGKHLQMICPVNC